MFRSLRPALVALVLVVSTVVATAQLVAPSQAADSRRHHHRHCHVHHRCHHHGQPSTTATPTATAAPTTTATSTATATTTAATTAATTANTPVPATPSYPSAGAHLYDAGAYLYSSPGAVDWALTAQMRAFLATFTDQVGTSFPILTGANGNQWGMVFRDGTASDPVWKLTGNVPSTVSFLSTVGFHAPADLSESFTGTSDSPMVVVDHATGETVWAAKVSRGPGYTINVGAAGVFVHGGNGLDRRRSESNSTANLRSRGVIPDSMVIPRNRLDQAVAGHTDLGYTLEMFWPETDSAAGSRFPMVGAESGDEGWGAEGQRISIDPSVDLTTRRCTPYALAIALTLQRHGAYIGDNAGGPAALKLEQDQPAHPVWGSSIANDELAGCITWSDFVADQTPS